MGVGCQRQFVNRFWAVLLRSDISSAGRTPALARPTQAYTSAGSGLRTPYTCALVREFGENRQMEHLLIPLDFREDVRNLLMSDRWQHTLIVLLAYIVRKLFLFNKRNNNVSQSVGCMHQCRGVTARQCFRGVIPPHVTAMLGTPASAAARKSPSVSVINAHWAGARPRCAQTMASLVVLLGATSLPKTSSK